MIWKIKEMVFDAYTTDNKILYMLQDLIVWFQVLSEYFFLNVCYWRQFAQSSQDMFCRISNAHLIYFEPRRSSLTIDTTGLNNGLFH